MLLNNYLVSQYAIYYERRHFVHLNIFDPDFEFIMALNADLLQGWKTYLLNFVKEGFALD